MPHANTEKVTRALGLLALLVLGVGLIAGLCLAVPKYNVWRRGLAGEAMLRYAAAEKKVLIEQAKAEAEAAKLQAEAINTVGAAAQQYPEWRQQEFIRAFANALENESIQKMIFVPTEANIPIVEAGRTVGN